MPEQWQSNAQWELDVYEGNITGHHITSDTHRTESEARGVCQLLEKHGFGGAGKHFPIRTWVSEVKQ